MGLLIRFEGVRLHGQFSVVFKMKQSLRQRLSKVLSWASLSEKVNTTETPTDMPDCQTVWRMQDLSSCHQLFRSSNWCKAMWRHALARRIKVCQKATWLAAIFPVKKTTSFGDLERPVFFKQRVLGGTSTHQHPILSSHAAARIVFWPCAVGSLGLAQCFFSKNCEEKRVDKFDWYNVITSLRRKWLVA